MGFRVTLPLRRAHKTKVYCLFAYSMLESSYSDIISFSKTKGSPAWTDFHSPGIKKESIYTIS